MGVVGAALRGFGKALSKKSGTIKTVPIAKNLSTKRAIQDKVVAAVDEGTRKGLKGATPSPHLKQSMSKSKNVESKRLKSISYTYDDIVAIRKKAKKNLKETKTLLKAAGATATAGAGTAGVSLYNKKKKK